MALSRWVGRAIGLDVHRDFCVVAICEEGEVRSRRSGAEHAGGPDGVRREPAGVGSGGAGGDRAAAGRWRGSSSRTSIGWSWSARMTPGSRRRARRPTGSTRARWRGCCGRASWSRCGCPTSAAACCGAGWRGASSCVHSRTRAKNEIHAVLQRRLQGKPPCSDLFGVKGRRWLAGLELPLEERESVDAGIRHIDFLDGEIAAVERLIAQQALEWPEIRRLMTVPGVNLICAATLHRRRRRPVAGSSPAASWSPTSAWTRRSASPARRRRAAAGSASAARRPRAGRWSRRPGASSCSPARCTPSMTAPARAAGTARRSSRPPASSRSCSGACSRAARTTPTSNPR